jgi:hypothetical protein
MGGAGSSPRYAVRPGEEPGQWLVFDTHVNAPVFGAENMTESAATDHAQRLNRAYREFRGAARPS